MTGQLRARYTVGQLVLWRYREAVPNVELLVPARIVAVKASRIFVSTLLDVWNGKLTPVPRNSLGIPLVNVGTIPVKYMFKNTIHCLRPRQLVTGPEAVARLVEMRIFGQF